MKSSGTGTQGLFRPWTGTSCSILTVRLDSDYHCDRGFFLSLCRDDEAFLSDSVNPEAGLFAFLRALHGDAVAGSPEKTCGDEAVHVGGEAGLYLKAVIVRDNAQDPLAD